MCVHALCVWFVALWCVNCCLSNFLYGVLLCGVGGALWSGAAWCCLSSCGVAHVVCRLGLNFASDALLPCTGATSRFTFYYYHYLKHKGIIVCADNLRHIN